MKRCWIQKLVLERILHEAVSKFPLETGGLLIGYCAGDDNDAIILDMVGPGPNAKHRRWTYRPDYSFHREECDRIFKEREGMLTYLGDWHSHPGSIPYLSFLDKRALRNIARYPDNYMDRPIMLVIGENSGNWSPSVWRIAPLKNRFPWSRWEYVPLEINVYE